MIQLHDLTTAQLKQAVHLKEQIETLQEKLDALLGGSSPASSGPTKGKRTMTAAGRAKIAAAQKARWAKINGKASTKKSAPAKAAVKAAPVKATVNAAPKKKVMSPEAKAKIAAAMKARWAAKKKGDAAS